VKLLILLGLTFSINTFSLTEDYILYTHAEIKAKSVEAKKTKSRKIEICEKYSKTEEVEELCLDSSKSNSTLKTSLENAKSELAQKYIILSKNLTKTNIINCNIISSSIQNELACLIMVENKTIKSNEQIISCGGLTPAEEINCLKFRK
tara:strand:- start:313 stop:759 length:447 start_codon:yes stop_codon:yes gene_type:complete